MELFIYLAKSALLLSFFFGTYHLLLRSDTHFKVHRWFLISGMIASITIPFIAFTRIVYKEVTMISEGTTAMLPPAETLTTTEAPIASFSWGSIITYLYIAGALFCSIRLLWRLTTVLWQVSKEPAIRKGNFRHVHVKETIQPFSFFHYIVYNPTLHPEEELQMILKHESAHARQWHSIDVILAHLLVAFQWINPFAWWYKKDMEQNLEFLADYTTAQYVPSKKEYQLALVRISSPEQTPVLTTPFYQSFIKKRIIMLNKEHSKKSNLWKMSWVLPLIAVFLWSFNVKEEIVYQPKQTAVQNTLSEVIASETVATTSVASEEVKLIPISETKTNSTHRATSKVEEKATIIGSEEKSNTLNKGATQNQKVVNHSITVKERYLITKNTTDAELEEIKADIKKTHNIDLNYEVQRNSKGEIYSLRMQHSGNGNNGNFHVNDDEGISDFYFLIDDEGRSSFWSEGQEERTKELALRAKERAKRLEERMIERKERLNERFEERNEERLALMEERRGNRLTEKREELAERREELDERRKELALRRAELAERRTQMNRSSNGLNVNGTVFYESSRSNESVRINKDMSDADLKALKDRLAAKGVEFDYRRVKRNEHNEITSIKIEVKKGDRSKTVTTIDSDDGAPIEPIFISM